MRHVHLGQRALRLGLPFSILLAAACGQNGVGATPAPSGESAATTASDDGLAEAYARFEARYRSAGGDSHTSMAFGANPALSTLAIGNDAAKTGTVNIEFATGHITASLSGAQAGEGFDVWFVTNVEGDSRTVRPEPGDAMVFVGSFAPSAGSTRALDVIVPRGTAEMDLDLVVVTRAGVDPTAGLVASGARTLFEKRYLRSRLGLVAPAIDGALSNAVASNDPLVRRGAAIFVNETFGGNGRTCSTCHRLENNLTIDAAFIATLPPSDPLFVNETVPALAGLEDSALLKSNGLVRANVDGSDDLANKFVMRTTPHMLGMSTTLGLGDAPATPVDSTPPDQRAGWGGDGAPGRGTLHEFAIGAVVQHFPLTPNRAAGSDFRLPTQAELDALEAFQLFNGTQRDIHTERVTFADAAAEAGKVLVLGKASCVGCHKDVIGNTDNVDFMLDTNVEALSRPIGIPVDRGLGRDGTLATGFGNGRFNVMPLLEAADTAPFFHNGAVSTIEDAVRFYTSATFKASPANNFTGAVTLTDAEIDQVGAYLRTINAIENIREIVARVSFVKANPSNGDADLVRYALADLDDAIDDLEPKGFGARAVAALKTAKDQLAVATAKASVPTTGTSGTDVSAIDAALAALADAKAALVQSDPTSQF